MLAWPREKLSWETVPVEVQAELLERSHGEKKFQTRQNFHLNGAACVPTDDTMCSGTGWPGSANP